MEAIGADEANESDENESNTQSDTGNFSRRVIEVSKETEDEQPRAEDKERGAGVDGSGPD